MTSENYLKFSPFFAKAYALTDGEWENLQDRIGTLPKNLYEFLISNKTAEFIEKLVVEQNLTEASGVEISSLIRALTTADIFIGDMVKSVITNTGVDPDQARLLANIIVSDLLQPVLADIKRVQAAKFRDRITKRPLPPYNPTKTQGEDLPESGGNIIDLRNK